MAKSVGFCRQCSRAIDPRSTTCPHCGIAQPVRRRNFFKPVSWVLAVLVIGAAVVFFLRPEAPPAVSPEAPTAPAPVDERRPAPVMAETPPEPMAPPPVSPTAAAGPYDSRARAAARDFVREQLESAETAVFSADEDTQVSPLAGGSPNQWRVEGHVDSTDIVSGSVVRKRYEVVLEFEDGRPDSVRMVSALIN